MFGNKLPISLNRGGPLNTLKQLDCPNKTINPYRDIPRRISDLLKQRFAHELMRLCRRSVRPPLGRVPTLRGQLRGFGKGQMGRGRGRGVARGRWGGRDRTAGRPAGSRRGGAGVHSNGFWSCSRSELRHTTSPESTLGLTFGHVADERWVFFFFSGVDFGKR